MAKMSKDHSLVTMTNGNVCQAKTHFVGLCLYQCCFLCRSSSSLLANYHFWVWIDHLASNLAFGFLSFFGEGKAIIFCWNSLFHSYDRRLSIFLDGCLRSSAQHSFGIDRVFSLTQQLTWTANGKNRSPVLVSMALSTSTLYAHRRRYFMLLGRQRTVQMWCTLDSACCCYFFYFWPHRYVVHEYSYLKCWMRVLLIG